MNQQENLCTNADLMFIVDEVAVLMPNDDVITLDHHRYITVNYNHNAGDKKKHVKFIADCHRSYDPLHYPLIFLM